MNIPNIFKLSPPSYGSTLFLVQVGEEGGLRFFPSYLVFAAPYASKLLQIPLEEMFLGRFRDPKHLVNFGVWMSGAFPSCFPKKNSICWYHVFTF